MNYKIKSNQKLFNEWKILGQKIDSLSAIIQNDSEISDVQIREFIKLVESLIYAISIICYDTVEYIRKGDKHE